MFMYLNLDGPKSMGSIGPCNKMQAHEAAKNTFRKEQNLATNIHVNTKILFEAGTQEECDLFIDCLKQEIAIAKSQE